MGSTRSVYELQALITSARQLGYWGDVFYFTAELKKLEGK